MADIDPSELPEPEQLADQLAELSRHHHTELSQREHAALNAADHWLRYVLAEQEQEDLEQD